MCVDINKLKARPDTSAIPDNLIKPNVFNVKTVTPPPCDVIDLDSIDSPPPIDLDPLDGVEPTSLEKASLASRKRPQTDTIDASAAKKPRNRKQKFILIPKTPPKLTDAKKIDLTSSDEDEPEEEGQLGNVSPPRKQVARRGGIRAMASRKSVVGVKVAETDLEDKIPKKVIQKPMPKSVALAKAKREKEKLKESEEVVSEEDEEESDGGEEIGGEMVCEEGSEEEEECKIVEVKQKKLTGRLPKPVKPSKKDKNSKLETGGDVESVDEEDSQEEEECEIVEVKQKKVTGRPLKPVRPPKKEKESKFYRLNTQYLPIFFNRVEILRING